MNSEEPDPPWRTIISPAGTVLRRSLAATTENSLSGVSAKNGTFYHNRANTTLYGLAYGKPLF